MRIITANEAAMRMPKNKFQDAIIRVNEMIERAARADKTEVRVDFLAGISGDKVKLTVLGEKVIAIFESNGFKVRHVYNCGQFVDVGIALTWSDKVKEPTP